ncbi:hypothetical protein FQZ97_801090 [compost metagenome]
MIEAILDHYRQVRGNTFALNLEGIFDQAIDQGDTIDTLRIGQLNSDIGTQVIGFLRVRQEHFESFLVEAFESLLKAAIGLAQCFEQTLIGAKELQPSVVRLQGSAHTLHGLPRGKLVNAGAAQGIEILDCSRAKHTLHFVFRGNQEGIGRSQHADQRRYQNDQQFLFPERAKKRCQVDFIAGGLLYRGGDCIHDQDPSFKEGASLIR